MTFEPAPPPSAMPPKQSSPPEKPPRTTTSPARSNTSPTTASTTTATTTTLILFLLLLLALFPSLFHLLWTFPLRLIFPSSPHPTTTTTTRHPVPIQKTTMWYQKQFTLPARARGSYLITDT